MRTNSRGRGRGQIAEAEDKILASRTAWPLGLNITGYNVGLLHDSTAFTAGF